MKNTLVERKPSKGGCRLPSMDVIFKREDEGKLVRDHLQEALNSQYK